MKRKGFHARGIAAGDRCGFTRKVTDLLSSKLAAFLEWEKAICVAPRLKNDAPVCEI
jgi:hypothetical protein